MKKAMMRVVFILTVLCGLVTLVSTFSIYLLPVYLTHKNNIDAGNTASIGIIGTSDGPTAVFISGKISYRLFIAAFAILTVLGAVYLVFNKYRDKCRKGDN